MTGKKKYRANLIHPLIKADAVFGKLIFLKLLEITL